MKSEPLLVISSKIRGGGSVGAKAWVAQILGPDSKWKLKRKFVRYDRESKIVHFYIEHPGIYQLNGVGDFTGGSIRRQELAGGGFCGFIRVLSDGSYQIICKGFKTNFTKILKLVEIELYGENPHEFRE